MAHLIDMSNNRANVAAVGGASSMWHKLGQEIKAGETDIQVIAAAAGLEWQAVMGAMQYMTPNGLMPVDGRSVLYRSDTFAPLGEVSDNRYKVHQPSEILEFFSDFLADNSLHIETAGSLKGGKIVWVQAKMGDDMQFRLGKGGKDRIDSYIRLQTSFDTTMATSLVGTTVRQVCANTMAMIESQTRGRQYRNGHGAGFDKTGLQAAFGLLGDQFKVTNEVYNAMIERKVSKAEQREFYLQMFGLEEDDLDAVNEKGKPLVSDKMKIQMASMADCLTSGAGADMATAKDTAFGLLQSVTYWVDHVNKVKASGGDGTAESRLASNWYGFGAKVKADAQYLAAELAGVAELVAA